MAFYDSRLEFHSRYTTYTLNFYSNINSVVLSRVSPKADKKTKFIVFQRHEFHDVVDAIAVALNQLRRNTPGIADRVPAFFGPIDVGTADYEWGTALGLMIRQKRGNYGHGFGVDKRSAAAFYEWLDYWAQHGSQ